MPTPMFVKNIHPAMTSQDDRKEMPKMLNIQSVSKIDADNIRSNENLTYPTDNIPT